MNVFLRKAGISQRRQVSSRGLAGAPYPNLGTPMSVGLVVRPAMRKIVIVCCSSIMFS